MGEDAGLSDGQGGRGEVGGGGEPLVGEGEDAGAEGFRNEICEVISGQR